MEWARVKYNYYNDQGMNEEADRMSVLMERYNLGAERHEKAATIPSAPNAMASARRSS